MALRSMLTRKSLGGLAAGPSAVLGLGLAPQSRGVTTVALPDLSYDYDALEPVISGEIMQIHHQKHHQAYVTNYNKALEQLEEAIHKGDASTTVKLQGPFKTDA